MRLLAAEDNEANQQVLVGVAEYFGFEVTLVNNGRAALDALEKEGQFDVVLMDCQMPVMDGYRATSAIREREARLGRSRIPIIAVTAHALAGERERAVTAGMDDYITKPIDFRVLARTVEKWGGRAAGERRSRSPVPPHSNGMGEGTALDRAVLEELAQLVSPARPRFLVDLVEKYANTAAQSLLEIEEAIRRGDAVALRDLSHSLKGSSRSVGARTVGELCEALERLGKSGETSRADELVQSLKPALSVAVGELRRASAS